MIKKSEQRCRGGETVVRIEDVDAYRVRLAVAEQSGEGREIHPIRNKVQCLYARNRPPEQRIDATGVYPGIDRSNAGRLTVNASPRFRESRWRRSFVIRWQRHWNARVPEFVARLALRDHVKICAFHVGGQIEIRGESAGGVGEKYRSSGIAAGKRQHQISRIGRVLMSGERIELKLRGAE